MFQGDLGFELVEIFQSDPTFGPFKVNDQFAEEAFTVYDHPKVLIFRKTAAYDPQRARQILEQADLEATVHVTPKKAGSYPGNLMLPDGPPGRTAGRRHLVGAVQPAGPAQSLPAGWG